MVAKESFRDGMAIITQRIFLDKDILTYVQVMCSPKNDNNAMRAFFNSLRSKDR